MALSERQRQLARHALGFPNSKNSSYRNHFCAGKGHSDYNEWQKMVAQGDATVSPGNELSGGDETFRMTLKGALEARELKEHLSREDSASMRGTI